MPLHLRIFAAMALGAGLGLALNAGSQGPEPWVTRATALEVAAVGEWLGKVFLALLQMVVVPLVFSSLVTAVADLGGRGGLGRLGARTLAYYTLTSALAIATGLALVNLVGPGVGMDYDAMMEAARGELAVRDMKAPEIAEPPGALAVVVDVVYRMIPENVVSAASSNRSILSVVFFALLFGVFVVRTGGEHADLLTRFFRALSEVVTNLVQGVLQLAPIGIFGYVLFVTASTGLALAESLGWYMLTVFLGLCLHAFVTLPAILWLTTGRSPLAHARAFRPALLTAFSTASSNGALPLTLKCATESAKLPSHVSSFVIPLGATVNMDGTALYEAVAVLFVAQMLGDLSYGQQAVVAFTALLVSIGAAGIPHAGTVMMVIVMQAVGVPTDAVMVILAVDRVLDMCRTTVNVWSDAVGAAVMARAEAAAPLGDAARTPG